LREASGSYRCTTLIIPERGGHHPSAMTSV
jgi:hypothetical protein